MFQYCSYYLKTSLFLVKEFFILACKGKKRTIIYKKKRINFISHCVFLHFCVMRKLLSKLILKLHIILIRAYINKKYKAMLWRLAYLRYLCNIRQHFGTVAGVARHERKVRAAKSILLPKMKAIGNSRCRQKKTTALATRQG